MSSNEVNEDDAMPVNGPQRSDGHPTPDGEPPLNNPESKLNENQPMTFPSTLSNISPGKKNKRKMAEPRRRITDFSIRNICSESTSCSSFASEIEADDFPEKKLKTEEVSRDRRDQCPQSDNIPFKEFQSFREVAPLDVLVSLSLLTQQHNQQLHQLAQSLDPSTLLEFQNPLKTHPRGSKQHKKKPLRTSVSESREDENAAVEIMKRTGEVYIGAKNGFVENASEMPNREIATISASSRLLGGVKDKQAEEVLPTGCKKERDSESTFDETVNEDMMSDVFTEKEVSDPKSNYKMSKLQHQRKTGLVDAAVPLLNAHDRSSNSSGNGGLQQRKNYKNMTKQRRIEANARERTRVHTISAAFESLRKAVPSYSHNQRLSKLAILRIACSYILALVKLAELESYEETETTFTRSSPNSMTFSQCVDLCTQTIQSEGKTKRRH